MIDEKALDCASEAFFSSRAQSWRERFIDAILAYESAKPKEAEGMKLGSRLTVEGVEAVVVPAKHTAAMALAGEAAIEEVMDYTRDTNSTYLVETPMEWAGAAYAAMLSAAGDGA